ncbi:MAG TPA: Cu(I)-responsive transcriptional regulator [Methylotenera sp.]|jgi:MerR family copper efflux transcriptional regulator
MNTTFNIGQASKASGISTKMIRHYESVGLLPPASRTYSGYRIYSDKDVHILRFIRQARDLGFSVKQIGDLLSMWLDPGRPSSKVKSMAQVHIQSLDQKINDLMEMKTELQKLVDCCHGDSRPECPILDGIAYDNT